MPNIDEIKRIFLPTGRLRASINLGNPILANIAADGSGPIGVSVDLANEFARRLGAEVELVVLDSAGKSVETVSSEQADIGFFAIDPVRGKGIRFSAPYVLITGSYLVPATSTLQTMADVDSHNTRVVVGEGSAYDLFLTRELKEAKIVRAPTSPVVVEVFVDQKCEVAAGVTQQLEIDLLRFPDNRLLPGNFMLIQQAMGTPLSRGDVASVYLSAFVEEMKATGFVADSLANHGIQGVSVATLTQEDTNACVRG